MNFKHLLFAIFLVLTSMHCLAQKEDYCKRQEFLKANSVWAFGVGGGLDFKSGTAVPRRTRQLSEEGCASLADPITGKLLFYSNGNKVWNANDVLMPNGTGLIGNAQFAAIGVNHSTTQGVYIVPVIKKPGQYYLFSLAGPSGGGRRPEGSLFYNIIDMSLDGGLGDVVSTKKNIALDTGELTEAMIAVPGNDCDVWLVVHDRWEDEFKSYHITEGGIDKSPIISHTGFLDAYFMSTMAISPDRKKICYNGGFGIFQFMLGQFDPTSGKVKIDITLGGPPTENPVFWDFISSAFSPDNSKLYFHVSTPVGIFSRIVQYDLNTYDSAAIDTSKIEVGAPELFGSVYASNPSQTSNYSLLRLYNDTIYMGMGGNIHRINRPNLLGIACDVQPNAIQLPQGDTVASSLGAEVVLPLTDTIYAPSEVSACINDPSVTLRAPEGYSGYVWDDGSTAAERSIDKPGIYWVLSKDLCRPKVDTFTVLALNFPQPVITVNVTKLGTTLHYDTYQWLLDGEIIPGAEDSILVVDKNGSYRVVVSLGACTDTSQLYKVTNAEGTGMDKIDFQKANLSIYPNPMTNTLSIYPNVKVNICIVSIDGKVMLKKEQVNSVSVQEFAEGIYFLQILDDTDRVLKVMKFTILR